MSDPIPATFIVHRQTPSISLEESRLLHELPRVGAFVQLDCGTCEVLSIDEHPVPVEIHCRPDYQADGQRPVGPAR